MVRGAVRLSLYVLLASVAACATSDVSSQEDAAVDAPQTDACAPTSETCNGADDDCDGDEDEDFPTLGDACTAGSGSCVATGVYVCDEAGTGVRCNAMPGDGGAETCNGIDDDCDGDTDEGFGLGAPCDGADADLCTEGVVVCAAAGGGTTCSDLTDDTRELCNGLDDDCDGAMDEGFDLGTACDGPDTDACVEGVIVCAANGTAVCSDMTSSTVELCNGLDDDCQNGIDDGFAVGGACVVGLGACQRAGQYVCSTDGTGVVCSATPGTPTAEICGDGIDQDCNGSDAMCPTNDAPAGAINISGGGTFTVDLTAARNDQDYSGSFCGSTGGRDVFYTFTLPAAEVVYVDTFGSSYDSVVRIFAGACTALGAHQVCYDDQCSGTQSQGALQLAAGTYCLVVDQYSSFQTTGATTLTFTRGGRPGTAIAAASGSQTGTTAGGTNHSSGSCRTNSAPDVGYHFTLCPATTRTVGANTCTGTSFDSVIYTGKAPSSTNLQCNDDSCGLQSSFTGATAVGPGLFWLIVDGYSTASGAFTLTYTIN